MFWEFTKRITLLKQRNWGGNRAPGAGMWVFSGIAKRITLLKQRNWGGNRAVNEETGCFGIHKTNYVVKTTELERKPRGGRGQQMESCAGGGMPRKKCAKNAPRADAAFLFLGCVCKMGQAAACWRAKSADGGGNRGMAVEIGGHLRKRTRATGVRYFPEACRWGMREKVHAPRTTVRAAMSSRGVAPVRDSVWAAALSPRRRGYAAKIMRRKNARRKFGKRASGESHYRNPCGIIRNIW